MYENGYVENILFFPPPQEGHWKVKKCEDGSFYVCKKAGEFNNVSSEMESSCPEVRELMFFLFVCFRTLLIKQNYK